MSGQVFRVAIALHVMLAVILTGCVDTAGVNTEDASVTGRKGEVAEKSRATVYIQLAGAYLREGNRVTALENAKKAVLVDPNSSQSHHILAVVYQTLGEKVLAEKHYRRAVSLDPQNSDALHAYASFLCDETQYAQADEYFNRALSNPLYRLPWVTLTNAGICARRAGKVVDAENYLRRALTASPRYTPALIAMAGLKVDAGSYQDAKTYIQRYSAAGRPTARSLYLRTVIERNLGNEEAARHYETRLRSNFPDAVEIQTLNKES